MKAKTSNIIFPVVLGIADPLHGCRLFRVMQEQLPKDLARPLAAHQTQDPSTPLRSGQDDNSNLTKVLH